MKYKNAFNSVKSWLMMNKWKLLKVNIFISLMIQETNTCNNISSANTWRLMFYESKFWVTSLLTNVGIPKIQKKGKILGKALSSDISVNCDFCYYF